MRIRDEGVVQMQILKALADLDRATVRFAEGVRSGRAVPPGVRRKEVEHPLCARVKRELILLDTIKSIVDKLFWFVMGAIFAIWMSHIR